MVFLTTFTSIKISFPFCLTFFYNMILLRLDTSFSLISLFLFLAFPSIFPSFSTSQCAPVTCESERHKQIFLFFFTSISFLNIFPSFRSFAYVFFFYCSFFRLLFPLSSLFPYLFLLPFFYSFQIRIKVHFLLLIIYYFFSFPFLHNICDKLKGFNPLCSRDI